MARSRVIGFQGPVRDHVIRRRARALTALALTVALVLSLTIAATAVTIGMRRAAPPPAGMAARAWTAPAGGSVGLDRPSG